MGRRGPAPTPTRLLALRGSWLAKSRPNEPRPEPAKPEAPPWLSEEARQAFEVLAQRLHALRVLTLLDEHALARYADLWASYRRATEFVRQHGDTYPLRAKPATGESEGRVVGFRSYPQAKRQVVLAAELLRLERELGLTPAARARLASDVPRYEDPAEGYFTPPARRA